MTPPALDIPPSETLWWQGQPQFTGKPIGAARLFRALGWFLAALFAILVLISWANRDEITGAWTYLLVLGGLTGGGAVVLGWVMPGYAQRLLKGTRYAVTSHAAYIFYPGGRRERREFDRHKTIKRTPDKGGGEKLLFLFPAAHVIRDGTQRHRIKVQPTGFLRLDPEQADAAEQALNRLKGAAT